MLSQIGTTPAGFNSNQLHLLVGKEFIEDPHRIRASSDTSNHSIREPACLLQDLLASFTADAAMKIAHHYRIWVSSEDRSEQVMRGANIGDPIAHGLVNGIFERAGTRIHWPHFSPKQTHAKDVQLLAPHILTAHVHDAFKSEQCADRSAGHPVLTGSRLRNDALPVHTPCKQALADAVVDFVRAGVKKILAREIDAGTA